MPELTEERTITWWTTPSYLRKIADALDQAWADVTPGKNVPDWLKFQVRGDNELILEIKIDQEAMHNEQRSK